MATKLQQYLLAKENGQVGFDDETKLVNIVEHPDREGFVRVYYKHPSNEIDISTGRAKLETVHSDYAVSRLEQEWKKQTDDRIDQLKSELAELEFDRANIDTFIADITPHVKTYE